MTSIEVLGSVIQVLDELGVSYMIGGSLASAKHGVPRTTMDADIIANLQPNHVVELVQAFRGSFYVDEAQIRAALSQGRAFNIIHLESSFKIDFFPLGKSAYGAEQFSRRRRERLLGRVGLEVYLATAEDTILSKLCWYRLGGEVSDRQWLDILGVLKANSGQLDEGYLRKWATELGVAKLLQRAMEEALGGGTSSR